MARSLQNGTNQIYGLQQARIQRLLHSFDRHRSSSVYLFDVVVVTHLFIGWSHII